MVPSERSRRNRILSEGLVPGDTDISVKKRKTVPWGSAVNLPEMLEIVM
jgi:hypothetical protein